MLEELIFCGHDRTELKVTNANIYILGKLLPSIDHESLLIPLF